MGKTTITANLGSELAARARAKLATLKKADLEALCRQIGQPSKGNMAELRERIVNAIAGIRLNSTAIHRA